MYSPPPFTARVALSALLVALAGCPQPSGGDETTAAPQTGETTADAPTTTTATPGTSGESTGEPGTDTTAEPTSDTTAPTTTDDPSTGTTGTTDTTGTTTDDPSTGTTGPLAVCGDGVVDAPEACDDGPDNGSYGACAADCAGPGEFCGDGVQNGPEQCDDGNQGDTDACVTGCQSATCGDGFVHAGVEQCDDMNADDTDACVAGCLLAVCGDGFVHAGVEQCDDMNAEPDDGCTPTCEPGFASPNVLFVLDYSTSMNVTWTDLDRWEGVVTQLGDFLAQEPALARVRLALLRFGHDPSPAPNTSIANDSSGIVDGNKLDLAWTVNGEYLTCAATDFASVLAAVPAPLGGNQLGISSWTRGAMLRATALISEQRALFMEDPTMAPHYRIVVITDGEWTSPDGMAKLIPASQNPALAAADLLANHNVKTHVIGIGEAVDEPFADELAAAGGTAAAIDATQESFTAALQQVFAAMDADGIIPDACSP